MQKFYLIAVTLLLITALPAQAEGTFIEWQTGNIQFLKGWSYEVGEQERALVTVEYANRFRYGDFFMFIDGMRFDEGGTMAFGEFSPRLSLSRMTGNDMSYGIVKDVLISTTYEKGTGDTQAYLYGAAIDLNLPGFSFFKTNYYVRNNPNLDDKTWQVTLAWKYPFEVEGIKSVTEGFADFAGEAGSYYHQNQFIVPRLLVDVRDLLGHQEGKLWAGVEYSYWHNKFGINGKTESLPQLQAKWVF